MRDYEESDQPHSQAHCSFHNFFSQQCFTFQCGKNAWAFLNPDDPALCKSTRQFHYQGYEKCGCDIISITLKLKYNTLQIAGFMSNLLFNIQNLKKNTIFAVDAKNKEGNCEVNNL